MKLTSAIVVGWCAAAGALLASADPYTATESCADCKGVVNIFKDLQKHKHIESDEALATKAMDACRALNGGSDGFKEETTRSGGKTETVGNCDFLGGEIARQLKEDRSLLKELENFSAEKICVDTGHCACTAKDIGDDHGSDAWKYCEEGSPPASLLEAAVSSTTVKMKLRRKQLGVALLGRHGSGSSGTS